jgi:hypothetical protein
MLLDHSLSPRALSPRALLPALFLGLLALAFLPTLGPSSPTVSWLAPTAIPENTVRVYLLGEDELIGTHGSPLLAEVRDVLAATLTLLDPKASKVDATRNTLRAAYGPLVKETLLDMVYLWVWIDSHWVVVCMGGASFELNFGAEGIVVVEARDGFIVG